MSILRDMVTAELKLADVVTQQDCRGIVSDRPFNTCIVTQVEEDRVKLFRPYGHTADFSYTGGVIPYTGIEEYWVEKERTILWTIYDRKDLK